jgi:hypothetical protein
MPLIYDMGMDDVELSQGLDYSLSVTRKYGMHFGENDDEYAALRGCGFAVGMGHPSIPGLILSSIKVSGGDHSNHNGMTTRFYDFDLTYEKLQGNQVPGGPLRQAPTAKLVPEAVEETLHRDYDDKPCLNSAGDPYDNPNVVHDRSRYMLTIRRNEASPNVGALLGLGDTINEFPWLIFGAMCAKCIPVEIPEEEYDSETDQIYYPMTYQYHIDPDNWLVRVPDWGTRELIAGKTVNILDDQGQEVSKPIFLNPDGTKMKYPVSEVHMKEFRANPLADFSVFNFQNLPSWLQP